MGADKIFPSSGAGETSAPSTAKKQEKSLIRKIRHEKLFRIIYRLSWISLFYITIVPIWLKYTEKRLSVTLKWSFMTALLLILLLPSVIILCTLLCNKITKREEMSVTIFGDITASENEFDTVRKKRLQERFFWIFSLLILLNFYILPQMQTWSAPLVIGLLDLFFIAVCGTVLGIDHIYTAIMTLINKWKGGK